VEENSEEMECEQVRKEKRSSQEMTGKTERSLRDLSVQVVLSVEQ
jgi:hypothetical protein